MVERDRPFPLTQAGPNCQLETFANDGGSGKGVPTHSVRKRLVIDFKVGDSKPSDEFQVREIGKGSHEMRWPGGQGARRTRTSWKRVLRSG